MDAKAIFLINMDVYAGGNWHVNELVVFLIIWKELRILSSILGW